MGAERAVAGSAADADAQPHPRRQPHSISIVTMRMPTLLPFGGGCMSGEAIDTRTRSIRRVVGTARRKGGSGNRGRPVKGEGSGLNVAKAAAMAGVGRGRMTVEAG